MALAQTNRAAQEVNIAEPEVRARKFTREEYYRAAEQGVFGADEHLELIAGEIIEHVSPHRTPHITSIFLAQHALEPLIANRADAHIRVQGPIHLPSSSEPEPDLVVAKGSIRDYDTDHPTQDDLLLVVEIALTSLAYDSGRKASLYASVGISDYWIVNLVDRRLEINRSPGKMPGSEFGYAYRSVTLCNEDEEAAPLCASTSPVKVADLLPSAG